MAPSRWALSSKGEQEIVTPGDKIGVVNAVIDTPIRKIAAIMAEINVTVTARATRTIIGVIGVTSFSTMTVVEGATEVTLPNGGETQGMPLEGNDGSDFKKN